VRPATSQSKATAPVARSVFWVLISLIAWEVYQGLRAGATPPAGQWALAPVDVVFMVLLPALAAFAFTRLFLVLSQTARGTLNVYTAISSPLAWTFWIGVGLGMIGQGVHLTGHWVARSLPDIFEQGEFAAKIIFLDTKLGYLLLGIGFFLLSLALLLIGLGAGPRLTGPERLLFGLGSLATYGAVLLYLGISGGQVIAVIAASVVISAVSLWKLPPAEITSDAIGALIFPGTFLAGITLIAWTIVVGGQPVWP
jgi:hypothetical protein